MELAPNFADPLAAGLSGKWVHPFCFMSSAAEAASSRPARCCAVNIVEWMHSTGLLINPPWLIHTPPARLTTLSGICLYAPTLTGLDVAKNSQPWRDNRFLLRSHLHIFHCLMSSWSPAPGKTHIPAINVLFGAAGWMAQWYLMLSYAYYKEDSSVVSDAFYDQLCKALWYRLSYDTDRNYHPHIHLVNPASLKAGTGYDIGEYPTMVVHAAQNLIFGKVFLEMK